MVPGWGGVGGGGAQPTLAFVAGVAVRLLAHVFATTCMVVFFNVHAHYALTKDGRLTCHICSISVLVQLGAPIC